jgi:hypothetical protein
MRSLLALVRREGDRRFASQALNELMAPVAERCGGRRYVPELIAAAEPLVGVRIVEPRARRLGLSYGPYIGVACPRANLTGCDRIGFDFVLRKEAVAATASIAGRPVRLFTPGLHDGVRGKDWAGYMNDVGLNREGSPFEIPGSGPTRHWDGDPSVYLPVRIVASYPSGRQETIELSRVRLSPGFG